MQNTQKAVSTFCQDNNIEASPLFRLLDLSSELGEIAKEFLHITNYGKDLNIIKTEALEAELGDALFSLICLANSLDINLESSLAKVMEKYAMRIKQTGNPGS
jgi:NTP pyrophosphatase (non-canonical NTP hydrolase)